MWKARIHSARLLDAHAMRVLLDQELGGDGEVVGEQDRGVLVAESTDCKLAELAVAVAESDVVVVNHLGSAEAAGAFELDPTLGQ